MPGCELDACFLAVAEESAECAFVAGVDAFGFDELVVSAHDVGDDGFRGCHGLRIRLHFLMVVRISFVHAAVLVFDQDIRLVAQFAFLCHVVDAVDELVVLDFVTIVTASEITVAVCAFAFEALFVTAPDSCGQAFVG